MSSKVTFESLCIRPEDGYCFDESITYKPENPENFEEVLIKLSAKVETSIFLIETHKGALDEFTLIPIPLSPLDSGCNKTKQFVQCGERTLCIKDTWKSMHNIGWDSLQVLAVLDDLSIPDNGSRVNNLSMFTTCILQSLRAYFMFQKPKLSYSWSELSNSSLSEKGGFAIAFLWKNNIQPNTIAPVSDVKRGSRTFTTPATKRLRAEEPARFIQSPFRREIIVDEESESEEEMEITFKNYMPKIRTPSPVKLPSPVKQQPLTPVSTRRRRVVTRRQPPTDILEETAVEQMEIDNNSNSILADVTLGFEMSAPTSSRKSGIRKSIVPDWPEEEKTLILGLFDNLNPNISEQKRIVLTCRYVGIQYEKELTSKILYNWIQKKGRKIERTIESFDLSEDEQKTEMIDFFKSLNPTQAENTRIAFTLKYFLAQFNVNLPSKQLYAWLNDKPVKRGRKSMK